MTTEAVQIDAQPSVDPAKVEAFAGKVFADTAGLTTTTMASIGDRLGLFKDLAARPTSKVKRRREPTSGARSTWICSGS